MGEEGRAVNFFVIFSSGPAGIHREGRRESLESAEEAAEKIDAPIVYINEYFDGSVIAVVWVKGSPNKLRRSKS